MLHCLFENIIIILFSQTHSITVEKDGSIGLYGYLYNIFTLRYNSTLSV